MNNYTGGGYGRRRPAGPRQVGVLAAAITGTALLAAACGGGGSPTSGGLGRADYRKEVAYARCMRAHGLPSFPDPQSNGIFDSTLANRNDFHGPAFLSANKSCAHLQGPEIAAESEQSVTQARRYAACMRAHGIATFQASLNGNQVSMGLQGPSTQANSTRVLIAQRICRPLLPKFLGGQ